MILVLGTGRTGTSEVARILHDELGVSMGHAFHIGDEFNPKGYYEDREAQALHLSFHMMNLDRTNYPTPWRLWRERFKQFIDSKEEPWGLKDPGFVDMKKLPEEYLKLNPKIILTTRDKEDTINSFMRMKSIDRKEATRLVNKRLKRNKELLKDREYLEIDCYEENKEEKIKEYLNG